jgi:hypothetical protein
MALEPVSGSAGSFTESGCIGSKMNNIDGGMRVWYQAFSSPQPAFSVFYPAPIWFMLDKIAPNQCMEQFVKLVPKGIDSKEARA